MCVRNAGGKFTLREIVNSFQCVHIACPFAVYFTPFAAFLVFAVLAVGGATYVKSES